MSKSVVGLNHGFTRSSPFVPPISSLAEESCGDNHDDGPEEDGPQDVDIASASPARDTVPVGRVADEFVRAAAGRLGSGWWLAFGVECALPCAVASAGLLAPSRGFLSLLGCAGQDAIVCAVFMQRASMRNPRGMDDPKLDAMVEAMGRYGAEDGNCEAE